MNPTEFYYAYIEAAQASEEETGVPMLVTLAQAALESGWGKYTPGNAFFGIKADPSWTGETVTKRTREVVNGKEIFIDAKFRAYPDAEASFEDHGKFLKHWPRYAKAFETTDPREFAKRIADAGYATSPTYAENLIKIIDLLEMAA